MAWRTRFHETIVSPMSFFTYGHQEACCTPIEWQANKKENEDIKIEIEGLNRDVKQRKSVILNMTVRNEAISR